ncbi:MAG: hypothetical protein M1279_02575 [Candidatus Marsarchaeota archaeon]|jgi:hypothetical protein|nr:hypothetical protein [Candidatus Marsarchaeota archaeon]
MVKLEFKDSGIEIDLEGIEKILAIKNRLFIPYGHIINVDDNAEKVKAYLRVGGTALGHRHYDYGRFITNEGKGFYVMKDKDKAFAIHLRDEPYNVIVLELDDNASMISQINKEITKHKTTQRY